MLTDKKNFIDLGYPSRQPMLVYIGIVTVGLLKR